MYAEIEQLSKLNMGGGHQILSVKSGRLRTNKGEG